MPEVITEPGSQVRIEEGKETKELMEAVLNPPDFIYKTIVVGDIAVGKSCLLHRAAKGEFSKKGPTIGTDRVKINARVADGKICRLEVWDTAGSEAYSSMSGLYYRDAQAALVCFNLCVRSSFNSIPRWVKEVKKHFSDEDKIVLYLVGCQSDEQKTPIIKMEEITGCCQKFGFVDFYQTSAKSGENVHTLFKAVTDHIMDLEREAAKKASKQPSIVSTHEAQGRGSITSKYSKVGSNRDSRPMSSTLKLRSQVDLTGLPSAEQEGEANVQKKVG